MTIEKKTLLAEAIEKVSGGEIEFNDDGTVKNTLEPTDFNLDPAAVIPDIITPTIPKLFKK